MAVGIVASATSGSQASVASFNISASLGTGARCGLVFVVTYANSGNAIETGVTWNGATMSLLYSAADTDTEPGIVRAYFLDNVTNGAVTVTRTNNTVACVGYAVSISAAKACEAYQTITRVSSTQNTNANTSTTGTGASGEVSVTDGSPGTNSMRFAASYTGAASPLGNGTNSTALQSHDATAFGSSLVRETNAGQGARSVGFATGTTDDYAAVFVAVREIPPVQVDPTAASLTLTGATPTVTAPALSQPTAASLALTGSTPTVATTNNVTASPTAASLSLTGATPSVTAPAVSLPTAASLTLTGATPTVTAPALSQPTAASLTLAGATPTVNAPQTYAPTAASLVLTGATPAVATPQTVLPTAAALVLTGAAPDVTAGQAIDTNPQPTPASLTLTGATPTVTAPAVSLPTPAALVLAGATPDVVYGASALALPTPAALTLVGSVPDVTTGGGGGASKRRRKYVPPLPDPLEAEDEEMLLLIA